jgi:uncharacterized protein (TIGR03437 family)
LSAVIQASDSAAIGQLSVTVLNPSAPVSNNISLQVINRVTTVSAASYSIGGQAPNSILAAFGSGLATGIEVATTSPLPASLLGTKVVVRDSGGISRDQALFFVAPGQVNFHLHQDTALGSATVSVLVNDAVVSLGDLVITKLSPAIFTQNASGSGVPAAYALRYRGSEVTAVQIMSFDQALGSWIPIPIDLGPEEDKLYLVLFGTGFRANSGIANASVRIGTETLNPVYAGAAPIYVGLDQLNVGPIPRSLVGAGLVNLEVTLDGLSANQSKTLQIRIK